MSKLLDQARHGLTAASGNLADLALSLARVKILALFLGPVGVGQLALVNNLVEVAANFAGTGNAGALNRELPRAKGEEAEGELVSAGILITAALLAIAVPVAVLVFVLQIAGGTASALAVGLLAVAVVAAAYSRLLGGAYNGWRLSGRQFLVLAGGSAINLALAWALLASGNGDIMLLAVAVPLVQALVTVALLRRHLARTWSAARATSVEARRKILKIAGPIMLTSMVDPLAFFYLRSVTEARLGETELGLMQPGIQLFIIGRTIFASFAGMTLVRWDQSVEGAFSRRQRHLLLAALALPALAIPLAFLLGPLWELVVRLLYTSEFLPAIAVVPWFVAGIAFHAGGFMLNQTLISKGHNLWTLAPRFTLLAALALALNAGFGWTMLGIGQAFLIAQASAFTVLLLLWLAVQRRVAVQSE